MRAPWGMRVALGALRWKSNGMRLIATNISVANCWNVMLPIASFAFLSSDVKLASSWNEPGQ